MRINRQRVVRLLVALHLLLALAMQEAPRGADQLLLHSRHLVLLDQGRDRDRDRDLRDRASSGLLCTEEGILSPMDVLHNNSHLRIRISRDRHLLIITTRRPFGRPPVLQVPVDLLRPALRLRLRLLRLLLLLPPRLPTHPRRGPARLRLKRWASPVPNSKRMIALSCNFPPAGCVSLLHSPHRCGSFLFLSIHIFSLFPLRFPPSHRSFCFQSFESDSCNKIILTTLVLLRTFSFSFFLAVG